MISDSTIPHGSTLTNGRYQGTCPLIVLIQIVLVCGTMATPEKKREVEELQTQQLLSWQLPTSIPIVVAIVFIYLCLLDSKLLNNLSNAHYNAWAVVCRSGLYNLLAYSNTNLLATVHAATFFNESTAEGGQHSRGSTYEIRGTVEETLHCLNLPLMCEQQSQHEVCQRCRGKRERTPNTTVAIMATEKLDN